jgi:hypothetical protein
VTTLPCSAGVLKRMARMRPKKPGRNVREGLMKMLVAQ